MSFGLRHTVLLAAGAVLGLPVLGESGARQRHQKPKDKSQIPTTAPRSGVMYLV
jgi:hypothetical protein